jgi:hypothetical protein
VRRSAVILFVFGVLLVVVGATVPDSAVCAGSGEAATPVENCPDDMATGDVTARTPLLFYLFGGVQLLLGGALTVVDWRGQAGETRAESDTGLQ